MKNVLATLAAYAGVFGILFVMALVGGIEGKF